MRHTFLACWARPTIKERTVAADRTPQNAWRDVALAFELRAMRVEYVIRLLVAAGHVTQEKVDEAFNLARDFKRADGVAPSQAPSIPADAITVNLVRLAGLDKHKARECEGIMRQVLAAHGLTAPYGQEMFGRAVECATRRRGVLSALGVALPEAAPGECRSQAECSNPTDCEMHGVCVRAGGVALPDGGQR